MHAAAADIVYGCHRCTQGNDYPLHDAVKNNASEALVMALLGTRPNEAKKLDEVRGRWCPAPLSYSPPRAPRRAVFYSPPAPHTRSLILTLIMRPLRLPLPCTAWVATAALRSHVQSVGSGGEAAAGHAL